MNLLDLHPVRHRVRGRGLKRKLAARSNVPIARMTDAQIMALSDKDLLRLADPATRRLLKEAWKLKGVF